MSLTVGYRDTSRGDGSTIRDDDKEYYDEECEKVLKEVAAYLQANKVALPSPGRWDVGNLSTSSSWKLLDLEIWRPSSGC